MHTPETAAQAEESIDPGSRRRFFLILTSLLITSVGFAFTVPFQPLFIQEIGRFDSRQAAFWAGVVSAATGIVMTVAGPIWGILADWFGHKRNVLRAAFGAFIVMASTAFVQNVAQLTFTRILMGAVSGVTPATLGLLGAVTPRHRIGFAVGLAQGMSSLGFTLGPLLGGIMVVFLGYRLGFAFAGVLIGLAGLLIWFGVAAPPRVRTSIQPRSGRQMWTEFRELLAVKGMIGALVIVAGAQVAPNLAYPSTPLFIKGLGPEVSAGTVGLFFTISGVASTAAAWGMGTLSTRFSLRALLFVGCLITAAGALGMAGAHSVPVVVAWGAAGGAGFGMLIAGASAWIGTIAPRDRSGAAFGIVQSANAIGFGFGPLVGGTAAGILGLRAPFVVEAAVVAGLGIAVLGLKRPE